MTRHLSAQQRHVLIYIYTVWTGLSDYGRVWGVRWATSSSRSEAASLSRTLRRLEERGLILRQNASQGNNTTPGFEGRVRMVGDGRQKGSRTLSVTMLPAGIEMAKRLTTESTGDVNRGQVAA